MAKLSIVVVSELVNTNVVVEPGEEVKVVVQVGDDKTGYQGNGENREQAIVDAVANKFSEVPDLPYDAE